MLGLIFAVLIGLTGGTVAWLISRSKERSNRKSATIIGFVVGAVGGIVGWFVFYEIGALVGGVVPVLIYCVVIAVSPTGHAEGATRKAAARAPEHPDTRLQTSKGEESGSTFVAPLNLDARGASLQETRSQPSTNATAPSQAVPAGFKSGIFISYRRDDKRDFARVLYERLARHLEEQQIFMDVDSIELGLDFVEAINQRLAQCSVMLVVIGNKWLDCFDSDGHRRIDNPDDFVRLEVETALAQPNVRVIPILVDGAKAPASTDLPESLRPLARRNALIMTHENFGADFGRLFGVVQKVVEP